MPKIYFSILAINWLIFKLEVLVLSFTFIIYFQLQNLTMCFQLHEDFV